jgi:hypothetical protein
LWASEALTGVRDCLGIRNTAFDEANPSTSRSQEEVPTTGNWGALRIVIEPTDKRRKWIARLDGRVLCVAAKHIVEHKGDYDRAKEARKHQEEALDDALKNTFPGSDPVSSSTCGSSRSTACHIRNDLVLVAALGIDGNGDKHPLGLVERATGK